MQEDSSKNPPWSAENLDCKDLFSLWKRITYALISTGHVADLRQELDYTSQTGRKDLSSDGQRAVESCRDPALLLNKSLQTANNAENNRSVCGYDNEESIDGDTVVLSSGESESDDSDDLCDISSNFIAEAADLSHHRNPLPNFEDILAQEESLLVGDGLGCFTPSVGKSSATPCYRVYTPASTPPPSLPDSDQGQWLNEGPGLHISAKQHNWADKERQDRLVKWKGTIPPPSATSPWKTAYSMKARTLRLSDKKDLMPSEISVVAQRLIKKDSVVYFLNNCRLIYESLMPSIVQQPLVCDSNSVEESVIAAFDTIQVLVNRKHIHRLLLRFAYIHLVRVIDIYKAVAAKDRVGGQVNREPGQRDITVAIDLYLAAKKNSKGGLSRGKLLDCHRRGKRWSFLAGPSSISVLVFSRVADTIVYVLPPHPSSINIVKTHYLKGRTILSPTKRSKRLQLRSGTTILSLLVSWSKLASTQA